ncbi:MAG: hypothetical protein ACYC2U_08400 [Candidatus Amoebophilus sp.]
MRLTYNFAKELKEKSLIMGVIFRISVFQFRPYHGTSLYFKISETIGSIKPISMNKELSNYIGRKQFNFTSGNYSHCSEETLLKYIKRINDLNDFSGVQL